MKKINEAIENYFAPKKEKPFTMMNLAEMINEEISAIEGKLVVEYEERKFLINEAEERVIRFPKIKITEKWGEKNNEDREIFETMMSQVKGSTVAAKVESVNKFLAYEEGISVPRILSNLMFVEIFSSIIEEYNASTSGFLFEAFLAGLFKGIQVSDPAQVGAKAGTLPIEDVAIAIRTGDGEDFEIKPYSLKVLSPKTELKGSFVNLVDYFVGQRAPSIIYLVVTKEGEGTLAFNEFSISKENFLDYIGHPEYKEQKVYDQQEFIPASTEGSLVQQKNKKFKISARWKKDNKLTVTDTSGKTIGHNDEIDPKKTYIAVSYEGKEFKPTGGMTANQKKLYGDAEGYENMAKASKGDNFWETLKTTPGYKSDAQFYISPSNYRKRSENLGKLDLYPPKLLELANKYAEDLGSGLVALYNALADLSININKYFIASDKTAGTQAIQNAQTIHTESKRVIAPNKK